mgnify:CR=1 FL=1
MAQKHFNGPGAGVVKYDVLTALNVYGLNAGGGEQISMSRLVTLITARYNWRRDELVIGQAEMSRLWGIGARTVKREVKRWLTTGVLICRQQGVRGRVATYRLDMSCVCDLTEGVWPLVGPDFVSRMEQLRPQVAKVIRLEPARISVSNTGEFTGWQAVRHSLADRFPAQFSVWIEPLQADLTGDTLALEAKSAFAAEYVSTHFGREISDAVEAEWGKHIRVTIRGPAAKMLGR